MQELEFQVVVNPDLEPKQQGVVAFGDFEVEDGAVFPENGVQEFYEDLIMGRALPLVFVTRRAETVGVLVAVTLFLHRDLATYPSTPNLVLAARLADRFKHAGLAHIDRDLADFFHLLASYFPPKLSKAEQGKRLQEAVAWIRRYVIEGTMPSGPGLTGPLPRIIDVGTNGFVVAEVPKGRSLEAAWVELYRTGYLRGVVFAVGQERIGVMAARKSEFLQLDLRRAGEVLNEAEIAMGEPAGWEARPLWLRGPVDGTLLPPAAILEVLTRM